MPPQWDRSKWPDVKERLAELRELHAFRAFEQVPAERAAGHDVRLLDRDEVRAEVP